MQFTSGTFLIFLPLVVLVSWAVPARMRPVWLLVASAIFYANGGVVFLLVLFLSIIVTYVMGRCIERDRQHGKVYLIVGALVNVALIAGFKYLGLLGIAMPEGWVVPLGISFYTLQAISYVSDVYHERIPAEHNFILYALYVSFFPNVVSGPIERAGNLIPQFKALQRPSWDACRDAFYMMIWGYFLKLVMADRLGTIVNTVYAVPDGGHGVIVILAIIAYTFQIYCDFAGYSALAIGTARLVGVNLMENFHAPYMSGSIREFWRRWHISLSSWLRDYVYIPLGGNRKGVVRKYVNLLITFAVSGIWHGVGLQFLVWGLLHGIYQVIGTLLQPLRDKWVAITGTNREAASHRALKILVTFTLVSINWVFFRAQSVGDALLILKSTYSRGLQLWRLTDKSLLGLGLDQLNLVLLVIALAILIGADIATYRGVQLRSWLMAQGLWLRWTILIGAIVIIAVCGTWGPDYNAASFIYSQF